MKTAAYILGVLGAILIAYLLGYNAGLHKNGKNVQNFDFGNGTVTLMSDTVRISDTILAPVPVRIETVRTDTIRTPKDTIYLPVESKTYERDINTDSVKGTIRTSVSGYDVSLDSVSYDLSFMKETVYVRNRKKWGWSVVAGPGVGYDGRRVTPFVGVTVGFGYNFK